MQQCNEFVTGMRKAGRLAAEVLEYVCSHAKVGTTTNELDKIAHDYTLSKGGTNACLGYGGYPKTICSSVNEVLCHGVPNDLPLNDGDIVNIDVTVKVGPYHGDTSKTIGIGLISRLASDMIAASIEARDAGIQAIRPMGRSGDIGFASFNAIQLKYPQFKIVPDIGGHGIGLIFHDKPFIPGVSQFGLGDLLIPGTCITVEPIVWNGSIYYKKEINGLGQLKCKVDEFVADTGLAAQCEHTVLITKTGYEILTILE